MDKKNFNVEISIKNLANMDDKVNMIMDYYKPKTKSVYYDKKKELLVFEMKLERLCLIFLCFYYFWAEWKILISKIRESADYLFKIAHYIAQQISWKI